MSIIPPGYAEAVIPITREGDDRPYVVTFGLEVDLGDVDAAQIADNVLTAFAGVWRTSLPTGGNVGPATLRLGQDGGDPVIVESTVVEPTQNGQPFCPQNVALLVQKRSGYGGRRNRGRMYFPGVTEAAVDNVGVIAPGTLAAYQALADDWLETFGFANPGVGNMVILHSTEPATPTVVTSLRVEPMVATQRRRLRR